MGGHKAELGDQSTGSGEYGVHTFLQGSFGPKGVGDGRTVKDAVGVSEGGEDRVAGMHPLVREQY